MLFLQTQFEMKYTDNFNRDFCWFLKMRHTFNFDGCSNYFNKKGENIIQYDRNGIDGKKAFYLWDSQGVIKPTKHPNLLHTLLKIKGSVNLHIKMYAEDRANANMGGLEFRAMCIKWKSPDWFRQAVENQKVKIWIQNNY